MRFMVIVKATNDSEAGKLPSKDLMAKMGAFNQQLIEAGAMLDGGGLRPSNKGTRISFDGAARAIVTGPFPETSSLVSGYWIWSLPSHETAVEWARRAPMPDGAELEVRELSEPEDFAGAV